MTAKINHSIIKAYVLQYVSLNILQNIGSENEKDILKSMKIVLEYVEHFRGACYWV